MRVLPRVTVRVLRSNASFTRRSVSSRIACFDISRFLTFCAIGHTGSREPQQRVLRALQRKHLEHQVKTLISVIGMLRELANKEKHNPIHGVHSRLKKARQDLIEKEGTFAKLDAHENSN
jgi:hypothetical protein